MPTARMRQGDFGEVAAVFPNFRLYDPLTGNPATGVGRVAFPNNVIPANRISNIAKLIQETYPRRTPATSTGNGIADDYVVQRAPTFDRHNYDVKVSFNRSSAHQIWGKLLVPRRRRAGPLPDRLRRGRPGAHQGQRPGVRATPGRCRRPSSSTATSA